MKILVLAGGYDQIELIRELQKRGHEVILVDYFENPPAKNVADKHYRESTLDIECVKNIAIFEGVDLVTTACTDQALLTVAKVSEELNLPTYITYKKALQVTNKRYMKEIFLKEGIPTSFGKAFGDMDDVYKEIKLFEYPIVVKPCDCNSSKGVICVENEKELIVASKKAFDLSRSHSIIIEKFVEGNEISIDCWVDDEDTKILSVTQTEKIANTKDIFTIFRSKYPISESEALSQQIQEVARQIARAFDLTNCPLLIQAIVSANNINVIEFSARMGGGTKYKLIEYLSGVNIMQVYVNRILGNTTQIIKPNSSKETMELNYVYAYNGVFDSLKNFDECLNSGEIKDYYQYKQKGTLIKQAKTSSDRVAGFLLVADGEGELRGKRKKVVQKLDVINNCGNSMMIKEIYKDDFKG